MTVDWNYKKREPKVANSIKVGDVFEDLTVMAQPFGSIVMCRCRCGEELMANVQKLAKGLKKRCTNCTNLKRRKSKTEGDAPCA